jgi:pyrimidine deaminase RibD-like protein/nucleoid DNA-binding protein
VTKRHTDNWFMRRAVDEARKSKPEDDRPHPMVGVAVARQGRLLAVAHRGGRGGRHAEFTALEQKLKRHTLAGSTVYTTLEPCTTRTHPKVPCAKRLVERRVSRVVIGMLDPNKAIGGDGQRVLREAGIATDFFPKALMREVEELNRDFIRAQKDEVLATLLIEGDPDPQTLGQAVSGLLNMGAVTIKSTKRASVIVTLRLPAAKARRLATLVQRGGLDEHGVVSLQLPAVGQVVIRDRGTTLRKIDLVARLAKRTGLSFEKASESVDAIFNAKTGLIAAELAAGRSVTLAGFGSLSARGPGVERGRKSPRPRGVRGLGRNAPAFSVGKAMSEKIAR